jgi:hypothetical protein
MFMKLMAIVIAALVVPKKQGFVTHVTVTKYEKVIQLKCVGALAPNSFKIALEGGKPFKFTITGPTHEGYCLLSGAKEAYATFKKEPVNI